MLVSVDKKLCKNQTMVGFLLHHVYADQTSLILNSHKIFISGNYTLLQFVAKLYIQHSNFLKVNSMH